MAALLFSNVRMLLLVLGIIAVAGVSSFHTMPRMEDPILTQRFGLVRTVFPGADSERVESQITQLIEEDLSTVKGIKEISSESMAGISTVSIELKDNVTDVDTVWSRVRDELSETEKSLPVDAFSPKFTVPEMRSYALIAALKWTAENEVNHVILGRLTDDLEAAMRGVDGTESVAVYGRRKEEILVEVEEDAMRLTGLVPGDISRQIAASEAKGSGGMFRGETRELVIEVDEDFSSLERLGSTPISYGSRGDLVRLDEIAGIRKTVKDPPDSQVIADGLEATVCAALVRDEFRIDIWNRELLDELEIFQSTLPPGIELDVLFAQNDYVQDRLRQLGLNLLLGTMAVVLVVFLLMGWRNMIVVGLALPLSALIVVTGMRFLGIPIHQMSVTGLIIALGLLIDNAIVMVDEVSEAMRRGRTPLKAIQETIRHLALPLFGSTMTTTLAFMPIVILPGASGEFVGSIAVSVILAINASFLLAMTVVPAVTALTKPRGTQLPYDESETRVRSDFFENGLSSGKAARGYRWVLEKLFRYPVVGVMAGVILPILGFHLSRELPEQFFPPADRDQVQVELELSAAASMSKTRETALAMRDEALQLDGIDRVHWFLGESAPPFFYNMVVRRKNSPFYAQAMVEFEKGVHPRERIQKLQDLFDRKFPEARVLVRQLEQGPPFDAPVEVRLFGPDLAVLQQLGDEVRLLMSQTGSVVHTRSDLSETVPKLAIRLDEFEARMTGLNHREIEQQLYAALEGLESGSLIEGTEEVPIRVRNPASTRSNLTKIESLELRPLTSRGRSEKGIPLSALAEVELSSEVASIPRLDQRRVNEVSGYITAGTLPHLVVTDFQEKLAESDFTLPPGYSLKYGGEAAERDEAVRGLMANVPLLIVLMIAILVASFRSFRVALIVVIVGGLSIGLGLGALWLFGYPFGFMGVVGTMGLVGVAVNDAIVVMAGIRAHEKAKIGEPAAIAEIVIRRTRHIVATTLTTMAGFFPLIMGGGGFWPPVAVTIAGGVAGATLLALCFVPSIYLLFIGRALPLQPAGPDTESPKKKRRKNK